MWLMEILRICLEEQLLIEYYMIKHLLLLKVQNMMVIKEVLPQWFTNILIKKSSRGAVKSEIMPNQELAEELHKARIRKFEKRKVCSSLKTIFWLLI